MTDAPGGQDKAEAIGGYFALEAAGERRAPPYPAALRFHSARAGLVALLRTVRPRKLWIPRLICDSVPEAAAHAGIPAELYAMDGSDGTPAGVELGRGDLLLFVDLFGVLGDAARAVVARYGPGQVVLDQAQAFFRPPGDAIATLYSPRKFFGLPDGGLLATSASVQRPATRDASSVDRCRHLLKRLASPPEEGYADFRAAEGTLDDPEPKAMSALTEDLLSRLDVDAVRERREANFAALHAHLRDANDWPFPLPKAAPALCYPFLRKVPRDDARLRSNRLYVPTYWPEARPRCPPGSLEARLLDHLLPLPIDQRYQVDGRFLRRLSAAGVDG